MGLSIRIASESDAGQMLRIYAPIVRDTAISFELEPPSPHEFQLRIRNVMATHLWLVCEEMGVIAGYAYSSTFRPREAYQWTAEVTVYVDAARRRRGIGKALYASLFEAMRIQCFCSAIAVIALPNPASVMLHERLGFERVGVFPRAGYKLGRWHDVGWWQLQLRARNSNPIAPRSFPEIVKTSQWARALQAGLAID